MLMRTRVPGNTEAVLLASTSTGRPSNLAISQYLFAILECTAPACESLPGYPGMQASREEEGGGARPRWSDTEIGIPSTCYVYLLPSPLLFFHSAHKCRAISYPPHVAGTGDWLRAAATRVVKVCPDSCF
eukprot:2714110-Rhodomonas_salina.2